MNNLKLIGYEIKRLIFTKFYAALLMATTLFAYYILSNKTIFGTAYTAPFSQLSFAAYLFDVLPFLLLIMLFFCTYVYSRKERRVCSITLCTPLSEKKYYMLKSATIALAYMITVIIVLAMSLAFYGYVFHYYNFVAFIGPLILVLLPPFLFFFGAGMLLGRINVNLLYILLFVAFIEGLVGVSLFGQYGLLDKTIVTAYPYSLLEEGSSELPFAMPAGYTLVRWAWGSLGAVLFTCLLFIKNKRRNKK